MASVKISDPDAGFIKLILRSPDSGDGWRQVSQPLWLWVTTRFEAKELLETEPVGTAGRVRLTPTGATLAHYLA